MATNNTVNASEEEARALLEESREQDWKGRSFMRSLFLGQLEMDWIDPFPETGLSPDFLEFYARLEEFLVTKVDSIKIDATGEYGDDVLEGLAALGAFGIKTPKEYGGLGFNVVEYCKALELVGRFDGNICALLSAHQSIGLPQPLYLFGTEAQKQKYLPPCASGTVSAFALTEPDVGSDPARLATTLVRGEDGDFVLNGEKLWITNSTIAGLFVVMARHADTKKISAVIVEADQEGVEIAHRCRFMGLKALANGVVRFTDVVVKKDAIIGKEGSGLKVAFITLNTGRLSIPAACVGGAKAAVEIVREWCTERVQWGQPIGRHEAIAHKMADMAATTHAMESLSSLANELSMRDGYDIRLEASCAKEWVTTRGWDLSDDLMQIRGGRGYETEASLRDRGEKPINVERNLRDSRINRIFEGSSEVMHLFMAREMVDKHLQIAGVMLDVKAPIADKLKALPSIVKFYAGWYPKLWLGWIFRPSYEQYGKLAKHLRWVEAASRKLARNVFHGMMIHQAKLEKKQAFMFRIVDIAMELMVMAATIARTKKMVGDNPANAEAVHQLTDLYLLNGRRIVDQRFQELWSNDDNPKYAVGRAILDQKHTWLEPVPTYTAPDATDDVSAAAK